MSILGGGSHIGVLCATLARKHDQQACTTSYTGSCTIYSLQDLAWVVQLQDQNTEPLDLEFGL